MLRGPSLDTSINHKNNLHEFYVLLVEIAVRNLGCREATIKFCGALSKTISNGFSAPNVEIGLPCEPSFGS